VTDSVIHAKDLGSSGVRAYRGRITSPRSGVTQGTLRREGKREKSSSRTGDCDKPHKGRLNSPHWKGIRLHELSDQRSFWGIQGGGLEIVTTADRGLGWPHQRQRAAALAALTPGSPCPLCWLPMYPRQRLDRGCTPVRSSAPAGSASMAQCQSDGKREVIVRAASESAPLVLPRELNMRSFPSFCGGPLSFSAVCGALCASARHAPGLCWLAGS
jgi:hypothetical protein